VASTFARKLTSMRVAPALCAAKPRRVDAVLSGFAANGESTSRKPIHLSRVLRTTIIVVLYPKCGFEQPYSTLSHFVLNTKLLQIRILRLQRRLF